MDFIVRSKSDRLDRRGFTLIELVIVIVVLGILAAFAFPRFTTMSASAKIAATKEEMNTLKRAIVGNPAATAGGEYEPPSQLNEFMSETLPPPPRHQLRMAVCKSANEQF